MSDILSYSELLNKELPKIQYLVDKIIPQAGLVIVCGAPGSFKTNFLLYTSMLGCDGQNIFEFEVEDKFNTLWIDEENREIGMKDKISNIKNGIEFNDIESLDNNKLLISTDFYLQGASLKKLDELLEKYKFDMVVIDSIAKVYPLSERDEREVRLIFTYLNPLIKKYGTTFVLIHHTRKKNFSQKSTNLEDLAGSREFGAMADSIIVIDGVSSNTYLLKQVKSRYSIKCPAINFKVSGDGGIMNIEYDGTVADKYKRMSETISIEIRKWVFNNPKKDYSTNQIVDPMKELGYKRSNILKALKSLVDDEGFFNHQYNKYEVIMSGKNAKDFKDLAV